MALSTDLIYFGKGDFVGVPVAVMIRFKVLTAMSIKTAVF
jgi:hypothetical protein